jgi:hypothetical protein
MPVENPNGTISGLDVLWPLANDPKSEGDNHFRMLKKLLQDQFPGEGGSGFAEAITATETEINYLGGASSNIQDQLNKAKRVATGRTTFLANGNPPTRHSDDGVDSIVYVGDGVVTITLSNAVTDANSMLFVASAPSAFFPVFVHDIQQDNISLSTAIWFYQENAGTNGQFALADEDVMFKWSIWDIGA